MRYAEDKVASAEIFRLALQKMTEMGSSFTPIHYSVIYEYVTGINPPLTRALNDLIKSGGKVSDIDMEKMFINFVAPEFLLPLNNHRDSLTKDIQNLLSRLSESTSLTSQEAARFQRGLESYRTALKNNKPSTGGSLLPVIDEALRDTVSMKNSTGILEEKLDESQKEIAKLQKELRTAKVEALVDPLTELLNRRGFELQVEAAILEHGAKNLDCSFLMLDIDHFKKINDTHGHMLGDKVIQSVAKSLKFSTRGEDIVARVGGEEFAVVLPRTPIQQGHIVAENIRKNVEKIEIISSKNRQKIGGITISVGLDAIRNGRDWRKTLERADKALYNSKSGGRNRTTIYFDDGNS
jgi:diguanylate cyclase